MFFDAQMRDYAEWTSRELVERVERADALVSQVAQHLYRHNVKDIHNCASCEGILEQSVNYLSY